MIRWTILRFQKREEARRVAAATIIQSVARGYVKRRFIRKHRRRLVRERNAREKERRLRAAVRIQCFFRKTLARWAVRKRRQWVEEQRKEQREWDELEKSLEGLHGDFLLELMAIRLETGARGLLSRKYVMS